jgi:sulfite oxidase
MPEVDARMIHEIHSVSRRQWLQLAAAGSGASLLASPGWGWADEEPAKQAEGKAKSLILRTEDPLNAEPALDQLVANWLTPTEAFYIRSHGATPQVDAKTFTLTVSGLVNKPLVLRVDELVERFPTQSVKATLTCAGNRRKEFNQIKPVGGVQWEAGAIGNARWKGTILSEVLKAAGVQTGAKHVWFEGADELENGGHPTHFGGSIPLEKAMQDTPTMPGALLATEMNDAPLSPDHGFPLRSVVPGFIGARSVKWLNRIVVSNQPSPNHYLADAYKLVTDDEASSRAAAPPLYENIVNGAICIPKTTLARTITPKGVRVIVSGYALPSGKTDCTVTKVEVSIDGGMSWIAADLGEASAPYCWRLWKTGVQLTDLKTKEIIARVTDSSGAVQPEKMEWNLKGYMNNSWYRTPVRLFPHLI